MVSPEKSVLPSPVRPEVRGVAGAEVHAGEEDGEEGAPGHGVQEYPQGGVRAKQLPDCPGERNLLRRSQVRWLVCEGIKNN